MKKKLGLISAFSTILILTACGSHDNSSTSKNENEKQEAVSETETKTNESQTSFTEKNDSNSSADDNTESTNGILNPYIKESTKGQTEVVYNNSKPNIDIDFDGFKFKVSQYQVVHVKNAEDEPYSFKGEKEGYVITLKTSINNQSGTKAYFNNPALQGKDEYDTTQPDVSLLEEKDNVKPKKSGTPSNPAYYEKGETKTGFIQYELSNDEYKALVNEKTKLVLSNAAKDSMMREHLGEKQIIDFPLSGGSANKQQTDSEFYEDQINKKNIAEKTMLDQQENINKMKTENKIDLTLAGIQFTQLDPTESYKRSFTGFDNEDIVAATIKMNVKNEQPGSLPIDQFSAFLDTDKTHYLNQDSLERDSGSVESGKTGQKYLVFLLKKSEYEQNKNFTLRIRHIQGNDTDALKDQEISFSIKR
ncbi:DUF5068 domain-containing protein [Bacillus atrophaeus]|uniref:DUF5068 domain-containing protein n=1 Tax=Bacillus atrophaeus TaxID=1452 RepID=UPI00227E5A49|nr:DUF5068 domain-containing protein [Bacillus atrophaeus]MCY8497782.1 DUF5068 domain-containing protein [Bacillus atrophaeus]MCY8814913.1 DUF5068 domain-containing protein [Bacillus atrophaeus]MCY8821541.1 DUF5068 domain-containing protein [Bacillus atrophaeus]MCY8830971.1 DUF5068 domain-containing protein [Bacillus atrophaeus]MCY8835230.1 DUF5068 domain-containing protein [Bacillus atrophaeus]